MADWGVYWQAASVVCAIIVAVFGVIKIVKELKKFSDDREMASTLKRTEFFLSQHRRLFDNDKLYEVLSFIDGDEEQLSSVEMADKKRMFLTFLEEIALLVKSGQIKPEVAYYMFGYYANCVVGKPNFGKNINSDREHWAILYDFAEKAKEFMEKKDFKDVTL